MARWLTREQLALELGIVPLTVERFSRKGLIAALGEGVARRYLDPAPELRDLVSNNLLERFGFITGHELAEVLGVKYSSIRKAVQRRTMHASNKRRSRTDPYWFDRREVRRILAQRENLSGQRKHRYSRILVRWLRAWLAQQEASGEVLDTLIKRAVRLPDPERSDMVRRLWDLFDQVNNLLLECDQKVGRGGGI